MASGEITFRFYKDGDEKGIVETMRESFGTFLRFDLKAGDWLLFDKSDPGFRKELALVAEYKGEIVGHVQLVLRELRFGPGVYITTGGIANVSTKPKMRGRGIATQLMKRALAYCRESGIPLSSLFTSYGYVAHRIYRRLGYADTVFTYRLVGEEEETRKVLDQLPEAPDLKIRDYEPGDELQMLSLYERHSEGFTGCVRRTLEYWRQKLTDLVFYHTFFYERRGKAAKILVAEKKEKILGYCYVFDMRKAERPIREARDWGLLSELVAMDERVLGALARQALSYLLEEGVRTVVAAVPYCHPYDKLFKDFILLRDGGVYMDAIVDIKRLFELLEPELCRRLELMGVRGGMSIKIESEYGEVTLNVKDFKVKIDGKDADLIIRLDKHSTTRLIYGIESLLEQLASGKATIVSSRIEMRKAIPLITALFPRMRWHVWSADHW